MNTRLTIVLLVLFFAGLIGLWWADYARIPTERQRLEMAGRVLPELIDVAPSDIRRVEMTGDQGGRLAFERRDGGRWQMIAPVDALADQSRVEKLVRNLKGLQRIMGAETIRAPAAKFGLDHPEHTIRLFGADRAKPLATLEIGKTVDQRRYVRRVGQDGLEVVDGRWLGAVGKPAVDWREKALFTFSSFEVESLSVSGPGRNLEAKRSRSQWHLLRPIKAVADNNKVDGVLADLIGLRVAEGIKGYVADNVRDFAPYGLDKPQMTIELAPATGSGEPQVIHVGKAAPGMIERAYARRADQDDVVLIDTRTLQDLGTQAIALRSQRIVDLDLTQVDTIKVRAHGVDHVLALGSDGWEVLRPSPGKADAQTVRILLTRLNEAQTSEFFDPTKVENSGLDEPTWVVKVWQGGRARSGSGKTDASAERRDEPVLNLRLGRHNVLAKVIFAQLEGDPTVLTVPDGLLEMLPSGPLAYRDKNLLALSAREIVRLSIFRDGTLFALEAQGTPDDYGHWRMTRPIDAAADPEAVARLAIMLAGLRAESLITESPEDLQSFGLDDPPISATWTIRPQVRGSVSGAAGASEWTLHAGNPVPGRPGSRYAHVTGNPMVFTLSPIALAYLNAELRARRVLAFAADHAVRLAIHWPGLTLAFNRKAKPQPGAPEWTLETELKTTADLTARITPLLSALSALDAVRYMHYKGPFPAEAGLTPPLATLEVVLTGDEGTHKLHLGNLASEGLRYATTAEGSDGPVFLLADSEWSTWATPPPGLADLPKEVFATEAPQP